jgi:hypothetical protein
VKNSLSIRQSFALIPILAASCVLTPYTENSELRNFWHNFPGHENTLASYGYDRSFAESATPTFVEAAITDLARNPSAKRRSEYVCVFFYITSFDVRAHLATLADSGSGNVPSTVNEVLRALAKMQDETDAH